MSELRRRRLRVESKDAMFHNSHVFLDDEEIAVTKLVLTIEAKRFTKVQMEFYAIVEFDGQAVVGEGFDTENGGLTAN